MNYSMSRKGMLPIKMSIYSKLELSLPRYTRVCISTYVSESRGIPNFFGKGEQNATIASLGASMSKKLRVTRLSVLFFPAYNRVSPLHPLTVILTGEVISKKKTLVQSYPTLLLTPHLLPYTYMLSQNLVSVGGLS